MSAIRTDIHTGMTLYLVNRDTAWNPDASIAVPYMVVAEHLTSADPYFEVHRQPRFWCAGGPSNRVDACTLQMVNFYQLYTLDELRHEVWMMRARRAIEDAWRNPAVRGSSPSVPPAFLRRLRGPALHEIMDDLDVSDAVREFVNSGTDIKPATWIDQEWVSTRTESLVLS